MNPQSTVAGLLSGGQLGPSLRVLLLLTLLSLLAPAVITMTSFVRTVVVLSFLRQGLGVQQTPPGQVLVGLSLFVTLFTMSPVLEAVQRDAYNPYDRGELTELQALDRAAVPIREFLLKQTRQNDLELFYTATKTPLPRTPDDVPLKIAVPAFIISELTTSFQMGVLVLLPFLVVDIAVATILMAMGMMMVPPATIALPLKLMLFVLADGWNLVVGSIIASFR
jgi:flagellar biosynthesis protein FliP